MNTLAKLSIIAAIMAAPAFASVEAGQKLYLKSCKSCHGNGVKGSSMATQAGWDKWFTNDGAPLIDKHKATPAAAYFNGAFKNQQKDLHDFLKEYGSDSGNVPACG